VTPCRKRKENGKEDREKEVENVTGAPYLGLQLSDERHLSIADTRTMQRLPNELR